MKNIVIRVRDGKVLVSAPPIVPLNEIDRVVSSKSDWIATQLALPYTPKVWLKQFDKDVCLRKFEQIAESVYPLIADKLPQQPKMYVKPYKSRWGVAYPNRGYIILNTQLFDKPIAAIEYVILHEYAHFLHPNHGVEFHKTLRGLMPDYKQRKKLLKITKED